MGVELRPLGVNCNLACPYCYQNPQRDAGNLTKSYDLEAMKAALAAEGAPFVLFGGEPLLIPVEDLEALWSFGLERFGSNSLQTNGALITDRHLELFRRFRVRVGISVDGPGPLNDSRWEGTLEATRAATTRTHAAIDRLCRAGTPPSLIVTLHRGNATDDKLPLMHTWMRDLDQAGVTSVRLHLLEVDAPQVAAHYALAPHENARALTSFAKLEPELDALRFDVFRELEALLLARDAGTSCVWRACDPYTTAAVRGVEGDGQRTNCGRTNKDGIDYTKADRPGYERYLALYHTPREHGGCADCRFFLACKGQCPGTAIDGDFRNRTEHCDVWVELFTWAEEHLAARGTTPVSLRPDRGALESEMLAAWTRGENPTLERALGMLEKRSAAT